MLILLLIVAAGIGLRITYTATTGDTLKVDSHEGALAHNIVADGRWFVRNPRAEEYVAALTGRRDRLIDPGQTVNPYNDIWAVDFTIVIVAIYLVVLRSSHRWRWLVACGLCGGVGAYFRPEVLLIAPVLALVTAADTGWREAVRRALVPTLLGVLLLVPWTIRNYEDFHAFIPVRTGFWETMVGGLSELPNHFGVNHFQIEEEVLRSHPGAVTETPTWDSYFKPYVIRAIEQHPLFYLEVLVHRVAIATVLMHDNWWMPRGAGGFHGYKGGPLAFVLDRPMVVLEDALEPLVFLLAMLSLAFTWRRWSSRHRILVAVVLCALLPYIAIHVEARYLLPAAFAYFIWIGLGTDLLIERVRQRRSEPHGHEPPGHQQRAAELQPSTVGGPLGP